MAVQVQYPDVGDPEDGESIALATDAADIAEEAELIEERLKAIEASKA